MNHYNKVSGFTMIELLVTIAIIAILTAIVMGNLSNSRAKARDAVRISDLEQLRLAFELYYDRCGEYPIWTGNPGTLSANNGCPSGITFGSFISKIPSPSPNIPGAATYGYMADQHNGKNVNYVLQTILEKNNSILEKGLTSMPQAQGTWYDYNYWDDCGGAGFNPYVYCISSK